MTHPWCSDIERDAAVRAAEDAAAGPPLPEWRELPERVARLEAVVAQIRAESETQQTHPACQTHSTPSEVSAVEWQPAETDGMRGGLAACRDGWRRRRHKDLAIDDAWERCEIERLRRDCDARVGEVKMERDGAKKRCAELEARVAELEAVVTKSHPANAATEETSRGGEAVAFTITAEEREAVAFAVRQCQFQEEERILRGLLERAGGD